MRGWRHQKIMLLPITYMNRSFGRQLVDGCRQHIEKIGRETSNMDYKSQRKRAYGGALCSLQRTRVDAYRSDGGRKRQMY